MTKKHCMDSFIIIHFAYKNAPGRERKPDFGVK
jgi:hypothetical protein